MSDDWVNELLKISLSPPTEEQVSSRLAYKQKQVVIATKWRKENKERADQRRREHYAEHPEGQARRGAKRRARKAAATIEPVRANFFALALEAWDHRCAYCGVKFSKDTRPAREHFQPLSDRYQRRVGGGGGVEAEYNIVPSCQSCNSSKGDRDPFAFLYDLGRLRSIAPPF